MRRATRALSVAVPALCAAACVLGAPGRAWAFDAGTTHAGLTWRAAMSSSLGRQLLGRFGLAQGYFELLRLDVPGERGEVLSSRLRRLDPAGGAAPDEGKLPALGWLLAGSIVEEVPPERGRHHFFDPLTGRGLDDGGPMRGAGYRLAGVASGLGSVRGLFTGTAFDGTGLASTAWLSATENELGLSCFLDARQRAVTAETTNQRQSALAEALLCAGAMLHVVEDAADPAHVHNDFRADLYDSGAPFTRYVLSHYGRLSFPPPAGPAKQVAHLAELIATPDGTGLADTTARSFYSEGLLPDGLVPPGVTLPAVRPGLPPLVAGPEVEGYVKDTLGRRLAMWRRGAGGFISWTIDERCLGDAAAVLVPAAEQGALSAIEHLFRGSLRVEDGVLLNGPLALGVGEVVVLVEDGEGKRRVVARQKTSGAAPGDKLFELPPGEAAEDRSLIALFHGVDAVGEPLVVSVDSRRTSIEAPAQPEPKSSDAEKPAEQAPPEEPPAVETPPPPVAPVPAPKPAAVKPKPSSPTQPAPRPTPKN